MTAPLRIGTRGSRLALWQAHYVAERLRPLAGNRLIELIEIETIGDQVRDKPLSQIGGDGVFTKEIQRVLLAGDIDIAVHSLKDLPTLAIEGLTLAAVPKRGPAGDVFVSRKHHNFDSLPLGATVATSSLRRRAMALHRRPDLRLVNIRGNVETRLSKLESDELDGIILAHAGLDRLGLEAAITEILDTSWMLPAVGQGALGLECRIGDRASLDLVEQLNDPVTRQVVLAERSFLRRLGGGCLVPIGVESRVSGTQLTLRGVVMRADGVEKVEGERSGPAADAEILGLHLADDLARAGANRLLLNREQTGAMKAS
ncbi:MAG TPA: hydroxymethylbilane synthase [Gemmataceae bacterium]|nr:hydroxymethylbilane synthase [Gemmataceae bacterium]